MVWEEGADKVAAQSLPCSRTEGSRGRLKSQRKTLTLNPKPQNLNPKPSFPESMVLGAGLLSDLVVAQSREVAWTPITKSHELDP